MDTFELLNSVFALKQNFPDLDSELILLAWTPRGSRIPERTFDRLREKYGISTRNNKVLEFVGDSVLGMITLNQILEGYGLTLRPSQYHGIHRAFISNENLTQIALGMGLPERLFPGVSLNNGDDWHNPCSNSIEATLAAVYSQYPDLDRIRKWFFSIPQVWENYQSHINSNIEKVPEIKEVQDPTEGMESSNNLETGMESSNNLETDTPSVQEEIQEPPKPKAKRVKRSKSPEPSTIRFADYSLSQFIELGKFPKSIRKCSWTDAYIVSSCDFVPFYKGDLPNCKNAIDAMELIMKRDSTFHLGKVPFYSEVYQSPGDGWYGYYKKIGGRIFLLSGAVPTRKELNMGKEDLAQNALISQCIPNVNHLLKNSKLSTEDIHLELSEVPIEIENQLTTFPIDEIYSPLTNKLKFEPRFLATSSPQVNPPMIEMDLETKVLTPGSFNQAIGILKEWNLSKIRNYTEQNLLKLSDGQFKFFFGKMNTYSKVRNHELYGYGVRYLINGKIGEIALSYLCFKPWNRPDPYSQRYEREQRSWLFNQVLIYLRDRLGIKSKPSEIYSPWDCSKYH